MHPTTDTSPPYADHEAELRRFVEASSFRRAGGVITDIDGTAVHEHAGRAIVSRPVELALKRLRDHGRPLVLNSLRFPLSVMRSFGHEWYEISNAPLHTVAMNGSVIGRIVRDRLGRLDYEVIRAWTLERQEVDEVLRGIEGMLAGGVDDLLLFWYPLDWRRGEQLWTPDARRVPAMRARYPSADRVDACAFEGLRAALEREELCMLFLMIEAPEDRLMAYQHTQGSHFITHEGVDKRHGAREIAAHLGIDLDGSVGSGDTELDNFLDAVGLSVHVGPIALEHHGRHATVRVPDSFALGRLLDRLADLAVPR